MRHHCFDTEGKPKRSTDEKAATSGTSRGAIERAQKLINADPDLASKVASGGVRPTAAHRQLKKREVAAKVKELPTGKYRVIYADPPWSFEVWSGAGKDRAAENHRYPLPDHLRKGR